MNKYLQQKKQLLNNISKNYTNEKEVELDNQVLIDLCIDLGYDIDFQNNKRLSKNGETITSFEIPSSYIRKGTLNKITKIGSNVFSNNESLEIIKIPDSVTEIEAWAFNKCTSLTEIILPNSVTEIKDNTFNDCTSLTDIVFSNNLVKISDLAFFNCGALKNIVLPNSLVEIGECAFKWCGDLNIAVPDSVTKIGKNAFSGCNVIYNGTAKGAPWGAHYLNGQKQKAQYQDNIVPTLIFTFLFIVLSHSIYGISLYSPITYYIIQSIFTILFILSLIHIWRDKNGGIKELKLDNKTLGLLGYKKLNNSILTEDGRDLTSLNIPNVCDKNGEKYKITKIGYGTFSDCKKLTEVILPNSITNIGYNAFSNCTVLKKINIPDSVKLIEENAFSGCISLKDINIPKDVEIKKDAFAYCSSLSPNIQKIINDKITYRGTIVKTNEAITKHIKNIFLIILIIYVLLFIIDKITLFNTGKSAVFSTCGTVMCIPIAVILSYISTIWPNRCELNNQTLKNLGYKKISDITSIEIPKINTVAVKYQERKQGPYKTRLDKYKIIRIGNNVFKNCKNLKSVKIPDSISEIGKNAFSGCTGLAELNIPNSVTKIEKNAFLGVENVIYNGTAKGAPWGAQAVNNSAHCAN